MRRVYTDLMNFLEAVSVGLPEIFRVAIPNWGLFASVNYRDAFAFSNLAAFDVI
jgi:hypothetical protein